MPLLGFTVFKDEILNGTKTQTIRNFRKYPIEKDDILYLYWHLRQKDCQHLLTTPCTEEFAISLQFYEEWLHSGNPIWRVDRYYKNGNIIGMMDFQVEDLAKRDGFKNALEMFRWFTKYHGSLDGNNKFQVIRWA